MASELTGEDLPSRATPEVLRSVILYRRVYKVPRGDESSIPTKGTAVTLADVTYSGITTPRVLNVNVVKSKEGAKLKVTITYYQIRVFA